MLAEHLVHHALQYALTPDEVVELEALTMAERAEEHSALGEDAGHSAVILSRERFEPSEGTIVDNVQRGSDKISI
jgi:hypothetical protein